MRFAKHVHDEHRLRRSRFPSRAHGAAAVASVALDMQLSWTRVQVSLLLLQLYVQLTPGDNQRGRIS